jgi:L-seryl-tRNA(Ser) seleniumtransferase
LADEVVPLDSQAGGGALPAVDLPGWGVRARPENLSAAAAEENFAGARPGNRPDQGRALLFDVRCLTSEDYAEIRRALAALSAEAGP